ncbi:hypothetical protein [Staphylococcus epidermidis]|nr:hypothetical protein [Staphylococcus epidermidis]
MDEMRGSLDGFGKEGKLEGCGGGRSKEGDDGKYRGEDGRNM